jgi:biopolymer transport protein ExbD
VKFPRNARIFRGQLDAAPFATVFFLLVMFMMLGSLVYTPGVHLQLPVADDLPGVDMPHVSVALDKNGRLYFESTNVEEAELVVKLRKAVSARAPQPVTLVVQADEAVSWKMLLRLRMLARDAGISDAMMATLPREIAPAGGPGLP